MNPRDNEAIRLKIRSLIADKELVIAEANMSTSRHGEWMRDFGSEARRIDDDIENYFNMLV